MGVEPLRYLKAERRLHNAIYKKKRYKHTTRPSLHCYITISPWRSRTYSLLVLLPATPSTEMENRGFLLPASRLSEARTIRWESLPARMTHTPESASKDRTVLGRARRWQPPHAIRAHFFFKFLAIGGARNDAVVCGDVVKQVKKDT